MSGTARIEVHAHLLPGVDDGCQTLEDALRCAAAFVTLGYSHCFCTPHVWRNLPHNHPAEIRRRTLALQSELDRASIPLIVLPGGEINLIPAVIQTPPDQVVSYGLSGRHLLIDLWAERIPPHFEPSVQRLQSLGYTVILAHPERMRAVQDDPALADWFAEIGVLLQGNFQCFSDDPSLATRRTADRFLAEDRYFMLGMDLHGYETLPARLRGMDRVRSLVDAHTFDRLTMHNPSKLLPADQS